MSTRLQLLLKIRTSLLNIASLQRMLDVEDYFRQNLEDCFLVSMTTGIQQLNKILNFILLLLLKFQCLCLRHPEKRALF